MQFPDHHSFLRKQKHITQAQLASDLGVSRQAVSKWESGLTFPDREKLTRISEILEIPLVELLGEDAVVTAPDQEPVVLPAKAMHRPLFAAGGLSLGLGLVCTFLVPRVSFALDPTSILLVDGNWVPVTVGVVFLIMGMLLFRNRERLAPTVPRMLIFTCLTIAIGILLIGCMAFAWNYAKFIFYDTIHGITSPCTVILLSLTPFLLGLLGTLGLAGWMMHRNREE